MYFVPIILIYSRLAIGFVIVAISLAELSYSKLICVSLLSFGLLSDILDGMIARHLGVSTTKLRRLDSNVDQVFFICVALGAYMECPIFFGSNWKQITILLTAEALTYVLSYLKFRKEIATHSLGAKFWTLILFGTLVQIILQCNSSWLFSACIILGILTRVEIMAIILTLKQWRNDVPSIYHAVLINQGKEIKKNKLFNG